MNKICFFKILIFIYVHPILYYGIVKPILYNYLSRALNDCYYNKINVPPLESLQITFDNRLRYSSTWSGKLLNIPSMIMNMKNNGHSLSMFSNSWNNNKQIIIILYYIIRWVSDLHNNFQLILWRKSSNKQIKTYKLKTVTYRTASALF